MPKPTKNTAAQKKYSPAEQPGIAPPWLVISAAVILAAVVAVLTTLNLHREKRYMSRILSEKGAALIRAFEAGTRTGIMGGLGEEERLQTLLQATANQSDILYIVVTDRDGLILADSAPENIGLQFVQAGSLGDLSPGPEPKWRIFENSNDGSRSFTVYSDFLPLDSRTNPANSPGPGPKAGPNAGSKGGPNSERGKGLNKNQGNERGKGRNNFLCSDLCEPTGERKDLSAMRLFIFVGMDITPFEAARGEDIRNSVITAAVAVLLGLAGVISLSWAHSHRSARRQLLDTRAFASEVVAGLPVGLVASNPEGLVTFFNNTAQAITGSPREKVLGRPVADLLPPELAGLSRRLRQGETILEREMECAFSLDRCVPLSVSASSVRSEDGHYVGDVFILKDLREVRRLQAEIQRAEKLAAIGNLAAGVAHEIRNPLSSIKGYATYFGNKFEPGSKDRQAAEVLVGEADRLNRVVTELLEFARPSELRLQPTPLAGVIEHTLRLIEQDAKAHNVTIRAAVADDLPDLLLDPDRLSQALLNLCLNAIQAMDQGGALTLSAERSGADSVRLEVADQGRGIPPDKLANIFDPYFTTKAQGTGLGLPIAHKITTAHGGEIKVRSTPGQGSVFSLELPIPPSPQGDSA